MQKNNFYPVQLSKLIKLVKKAKKCIKNSCQFIKIDLK